MDKSDLEEQYFSKFKNRGKKSNPISNEKLGNSYSNAKSRPRRYTYPSKVIGRLENRHSIEDFVLSNKKYLGRKQLNNFTKSDTSTKRVIHLPKFKDNLYLADAEGVSQLEDDDLLINVGNLNLKTKCQKVDFDFRDWRQISFPEFQTIVTECHDLINFHKTGRVFVVCKKGVNRSVSVCLGYAILEGIPFEEALEYLEDQKSQVDCSWSAEQPKQHSCSWSAEQPKQHSCSWGTLTNNKLRNLLRALE